MRGKKSFYVISKILMCEVNYRRTDRSRLETICMTYDPAAHKTTIAPSHYTHIVFVSNSHLYNIIDACHQVQKIFATPVTSVCHPEVCTITRRTSGVGTKHRKTLFRQCRNRI